jgi:EAL domain-containing protein (putative c-di-GMP-specific phosphodiesterase class I)
LTESVFIQEHWDNAKRAIARFKEIGCSISIDDFGTGYSSMSYLKRFPFDALKIDMSFIRDIENNRDDRAIVSAITAMAKEIQLTTIAEGVEREEQRNILRAIGCDTYQGYLGGVPLPESELLQFLHPVEQVV